MQPIVIDAYQVNHAVANHLLDDRGVVAEMGGSLGTPKDSVSVGLGSESFGGFAHLVTFFLRGSPVISLSRRIVSRRLRTSHKAQFAAHSTEQNAGRYWTSAGIDVWIT
jgi:hypothetical protein